MNNLYTDINGKTIDLSLLNFEQLQQLNYQEETYFAQEIKKLVPFSKKRNLYLQKSYEKIMTIARYKRKFTKNNHNGVNNATIDLVEEIIDEFYQKKDQVLFYEAGVGTGYLLRSIVDEKITILGCDVFLSKEAKSLNQQYFNITVVEDNLYDALDQVPDNSIDIFYADNVLEHIVDDEYEKTCEKVAQKIAPGGIAIIIIPNPYNGPHDITKLNPKASKKGFHFMEQTFNQATATFFKYNLICRDFCFKNRKNSIIVIKHGVLLNKIKRLLEPLFRKQKKKGLRHLIFKRLGYDIYILRKK